MSTVITFRVSDEELKIIQDAERMIQKPRGEIITALINVELRQTLAKLWIAGARPQPFAPPKQRTVTRRKRVQDAQGDTG